MASDTDWVDGWEIRPRADGGFGVYDAHGLAEGPFGTREEAMAAALRLPRRNPPAGQKDPKGPPDTPST